MHGSLEKKYVKAKFNFKGRNNDELSFLKDEIIAVTQVEEGGWWEGTLLGKTGWFPSNYVLEYNEKDISITEHCQHDVYRKQLFEQFQNSYKVYINDLTELDNNLFNAIEQSSITMKPQLMRFRGYFTNILAVEKAFAAALESENDVLQQLQKIGNLFLSFVPQFKAVLISYCKNHPRAMYMLSKYRNALLRILDNSVDIKTYFLLLSFSLSQPFRRLETCIRYLQELVFYTDENHKDRGDIQRSISVYKEMLEECLSVRKMREWELEVFMNSNRTSSTEQNICFENVLDYGFVKINGEIETKYMILVASDIFFLSFAATKEDYVIEQKISLINVVIEDLGDKCIGITELHGSKFRITCETQQEVDSWLTLCHSMMDVCGLSQLCSTSNSYKAPKLAMHVTKHSEEVVKPVFSTNTSLANKVWRMSCLQPCAPFHPYLEDEKDRNTLSCRKEERKSLQIGQKAIYKEKDRSEASHRNLEGVVHGLLDQVNIMERHIKQLSKQLQEEQKERMHMQMMLQMHLKTDKLNEN